MSPAVLMALGATVFLWASLFVATRAALPVYGPAHLTLLRFLVASAAFGVVALVARPRRPAWADAPMLIGSGLLGITVCSLGIGFGTQTVKAGSASMITCLSPVSAALLASLVLRERLGVWGWIGIAASVAGVTTIALGEGGGVQLEPGAGLLAIAALAQGASFILQKPGFERFSSLDLISYTIWIGTLPMLVLAPGILDTIQSAPLDATLAVLYLGVIPGAVAYCAWAYALSRIPASRASSFLYLIPALATMLGWAYLGEMPTQLSFVGGTLTLTGVILVNTLGRERPSNTSPAGEAASAATLPTR
jgi:drug/metabolite transporter (DMT)-like permease